MNYVEVKNTVFKDVCQRIPYGVIAHIVDDEGQNATKEVDGIYANQLDESIDVEFTDGTIRELGKFALCLRPLSSVTEEEIRELNNKFGKYGYFYHDFFNPLAFRPVGMIDIDINGMASIIDWFNVHHFDYRGLLSCDGAVEVSETFNPYIK